MCCSAGKLTESTLTLTNILHGGGDFQQDTTRLDSTRVMCYMYYEFHAKQIHFPLQYLNKEHRIWLLYHEYDPCYISSHYIALISV